MPHIRPIILAAVLLISACGAPQPVTPQAALQPTAPPQASASAPTAVPTEGSFVSEDSAPAPSPPPSAAAAVPPTATAALPATAEPTARLILPAASAIPPTAEAPRATLTPTTAAASAAIKATVAPKATAVSEAAPKATAAPEAPAQPSEPTQPSEPVRLAIGDIALDGRVVSVGLDKDRIPIVPKHDIGWYNLSARPGEGDNIVLWGHVLRFREAPKIPAPFARLKEVKPGASVKLYDQAGKPHTYVVTKQIWVTPDQVEYILPKGREMVTMVSCIGDKIIQEGEVVDESHRLITIAEPDV
jgi:sortase (surface protein transpeptidase)